MSPDLLPRLRAIFKAYLDDQGKSYDEIFAEDPELEDIYYQLKYAKHPILRNKRRNPGRPKAPWSKVRFTQKRVDRLPKVPTLTQVANCLGVSRQAVHSWTIQEKNPCPVYLDGNRLVFDRIELKEWLEDTKRYKPKKGAY